MASASRKNHAIKTGITRGDPDDRRGNKPNPDRAPGQVRPFTPDEKDYDERPIPPKPFDDRA